VVQRSRSGTGVELRSAAALASIHRWSRWSSKRPDTEMPLGSGKIELV
jgi:hypothetical protein